MKLKHSKQWYKKSADIEDCSEIGAGVPPNKTKPVHYCRMCRWYRNEWIFAISDNYEFVRCHHPSCFSTTTTPVDIISGKTKTTVSGPSYCEFERARETEKCGLDGKNFEPRRKWWKLWLA